MREIGSKSLREICKLNLLELGPSMTRRTVCTLHPMFKPTSTEKHILDRVIEIV